MIRGSAGEVRFERFGLLSGQNRPSDRARSAGEQTKGGSWGGPFWRICAAQRTKRSTRERKEHRSTATGERRTQNKRTAGQARFEEFRRLSYQGGPPETVRSTAKQTRTGRAGEVRFEGFGPLSGQNRQPERARSTAQQTKLATFVLENLGRVEAGAVRPLWRICAAQRTKRSTRERERSTEAQPQETGGHITKDQLGKPALRNFGGSLTKAGHLKKQGAPPSKPGLGELGRSVLQDLGR